MKKTITILALCLFIFANTQTAQAQTQEETIAWIKEKLDKYGGVYGNSYFTDFTDVQVSPCKISYIVNVTHLVNLNKEYPLGSISFNPSRVKEWKVSNDKDRIRADADVIRTVRYSDGDVSMGRNLYLKNEESDFHERMIKALLHLATFCDKGGYDQNGEKPGE